MSDTPAPVDTLPAWVDLSTVVGDVLTMNRMQPGDPDEARIVQDVHVASSLVDSWLDRDADPLPSAPPMHPLARYGLAQVTNELYRRKDAPFGVLNAWSPDEITARISNDPIRGSFHILLPLKSGWGVAG